MKQPSTQIVVDEDFTTKAIRAIRENWPILIFLVGMVAAWTNMTTDISQNKRDIADIKQDVSSLSTSSIQLQTQFATIQESLKNTDRTMTEIKASIEKLGDKIDKKETH